MAKIVVVGSANTDMTIRSEKIPAPGETVVGGVFASAPGGKGANQAVAAARAGGAVTFVARVGADSLGEEAIKGYERDGIDVSKIVRDPANATGVALIMVDATGQNSISVASGANFALSPEDVGRDSKRGRRRLPARNADSDRRTRRAARRRRGRSFYSRSRAGAVRAAAGVASQAYDNRQAERT